MKLYVGQSGLQSPFLHASLTAYLFVGTAATNNIKKINMGNGRSMEGRVSLSTPYWLSDKEAPRSPPISIHGWEFQRQKKKSLCAHLD